MKKVLTVLYLILIILLMYLVQTLVINNISIFGVKPNLILISVIVVSLWFGLYKGSIYSVCIGIITDMLFYGNISFFTICYALTGSLVGLFSKYYRKENKIALVCVTVIATGIFEIIQFIIYFVSTKHYNQVLFLIYQIFFTALLNVVIVCIVYSLIQKILSFFDDNVNIYEM